MSGISPKQTSLVAPHMSAFGVSHHTCEYLNTVAACDDLRKKPFAERKVSLRHALKRTRGGIQYVEHTEGDGQEMFEAACKVGLEGIVSKRLDAAYKSGKARSWLKIKNPKAPAATRVADGTL